MPTLFTQSSQAKNLAFIFYAPTLPGHYLCSNSNHLSVIAPNNVTTSSTKMHRYGIPLPIWQQIGHKTLTKTTTLGFIPSAKSQQWFWSQPLWNTNDKMGFNHFWMHVTFQYRGLHHLDMHCTVIIETWLKSNIYFDCIYLELWNACIISLVFIVFKVRDGTES